MRASVGVVVLLVLASSSSGCGGFEPPCMSMGTMSDVLARATLLRLDVYDAGAHCDGARISDGAPPPSLSKVASAGQAIKLDVPAGHHVLVLSAFADSTGSELIGSACIETDVHANQPACFNLALADLPDAASPVDNPDMAGAPDLARPPCTTSPDNCPSGQYCASDGNCAAGCKVDADCAATATTPRCRLDQHRCVECLGTGDCPLGKLCSPSGSCVDGCVPATPNCQSGDQCCSSLCIDVSKDLSNCGACGRACSSAHVNTPSCSNKLCAPACAAGWGDCNHPVAPNPDDGCETNLYDVAHCGACGAPACSLPHATPDCPSGSCTIKSCATGYFDCNGTASDGCECPGVNLGGATPGCCAGGACQSAHTDGFGHAFNDCEKSYSEQLARDAANAAGFATPFGNNCPNGTTRVICGQSATSCTCWAWGDSASSNPATGRARQNTASNVCYCPTVGDQPWG
jgi:hypothetical protein